MTFGTNFVELKSTRRWRVVIAILEVSSNDVLLASDLNLLFAVHSSVKWVLVSMTGHWRNGLLSIGETKFFGCGSNGGFRSRKAENALSFNGD